MTGRGPAQSDRQGAQVMKRLSRLGSFDIVSKRLESFHIGWSLFASSEQHEHSDGTTAWLRIALIPIMTSVIGAPPVVANVLISVNKNTQQMSVSVDGVRRYEFAVSTGRPGYGTPSGTYHPRRLERSWFSREYYHSPMPHSIFFHGGYAIHGSYDINRLGGPASHGCIRLHPSNAAALFALVRTEGVGATTIVVSGSNPVSARYSAPFARSRAVTIERSYNQPYFNYGMPNRRPQWPGLFFSPY